MFNSHIVLKKKQCKCGCGQEGYIYANGMLKYCYLKSKSPTRKNKYATKIRSAPKPTIDGLDAWFKEKMSSSSRQCENCGRNLDSLNDVDWKGSQHHVLPKAQFKSVATHINNHMVLGRWCCHPQVHTSWLNASKMNVWYKIISIFKDLFNELPECERRFVPNIIYEIIRKDEDKN